MISKAVIKCSYKGGKFSSKHMTTSSFFKAYFLASKLIYKYLDLVDVVQQLITFYILHVKNLQQMKKMLDKMPVWWML